MTIPVDDLGSYSLLDALRDRRSRRFGMGMKMEGALAFESAHDPLPLTEEEEALLVFAACGVTGYALADLVFAPGQGGDIMTHLVARAVSSGDGAQAVAIIVTNDSGTYYVKRPQDLTDDEARGLVEEARKGNLTEFYKRVKVKIQNGRAAPPLVPMYNLNCNRWSVYKPGTSFFVPIDDVSFIYINGLLNILSPDTGAYIMDERANFRSAGLERFAKSKGGHLNDDPEAHEILTIQRMELGVAELVAIEQGMMHQNLALMAQAMGIGGFPNFAVHEFGWFQALGFRMGQMSTSRYFGEGHLFTVEASLLHRDLPIPFAVGLEASEQVLLRGHCPPYFPTMRDAVNAVVAAKFGSEGIFRGKIGLSEWRDPAGIQAATPGLSEEAIEATVAYCEYVYDRYGRFPSFIAPFRTVLGFQATHLDLDYYDRYYKPEALSSTHREHMSRWHSTPDGSAAGG
ncbi:MAG: hypothetical protein WAV20_06005 [Blastocatellia bacterium]